MEPIHCFECNCLLGYAGDSAPKGCLFCVDCAEKEMAEDQPDYE